jgi:glycosyltransferase involved in cell wall biosynthesis
MNHESAARIQVLHLINCLAPGGASRATLCLAAQSKFRSMVLSLTPAHPAMLGEAREAGVAARDCTGPADVLAQIESADIVFAHTWNTPELFGLLAGSLPPLRLAIWVHVAGRAVPQVVPGAIVRRADVAVATSARSLAHIRDAATGGAFEPRTILPSRNLDPFPRVARTPSDLYRVAYVGALDELKLHPGTIKFISRIDVPGLRFSFIGNGPQRDALAREADDCAAAAKIAFRGWIDDMPAALADIDVLAVPMSPISYATAEIAVMEAMAAGIPPVVLSPEGALDPVNNGTDGLVVERGDQFVAALSALGHDASRRKALGDAARAKAMTAFDPRRTAHDFDELFEAMLALPKSKRSAIAPAVDSNLWAHGRGAAAASLAFADQWPALANSLSRDPAVASAADATIAASAKSALAPSAGGLLHYLGVYPDEPWLAYWCGLVLAGNGLPVRSAAMLQRARQAGFPDTKRLDAHALLAARRIRVV